MKQDTANFLVVNTAAIVTTLSLNMIVPSITLIGENLGIAYSNAQLIIGVFLFVYAFSLLVVTQVTARFGERHALILALSIFTCGSLICTFSPNLPALLFGRTLQAFGAAFGPVLARAIIRTQYEGDSLRVRLANLATISAIVPVLAPIIGGQLADVFGWRAIFVVLSTFGIGSVIIMTALFQMPNGVTVDRNSRVFCQIGLLIRQTSFVKGVCLLTATYCLIFVFVSLIPAIFIDKLGVSSGLFAVIYGLSVSFYLGGTQLSKLRRPFSKPVVWSILTLLGGVVVTTAIVISVDQTALFICLMLGIALFNLAAGYIFPFGQSMLLSGSPQLSTAASSIGLFIQNASAALISTAVTTLAVATNAHVLIFGLSLIAVGFIQLTIMWSAK